MGRLGKSAKLPHPSKVGMDYNYSHRSRSHNQGHTMKMPKVKLRFKRGAILLGLLVLVIAILVIGYIAYAIYKKLSTWNPRPINPDDVAQWVQRVALELPVSTSPSGILSDGTEYIQLSNAALPQVRIEQTTNLTDWYTIATIEQTNIIFFPFTNDLTKTMLLYRIRE